MNETTYNAHVQALQGALVAFQEYVEAINAHTEVLLARIQELEDLVAWMETTE